MKYPVGIQSFKSLREEGYVYVDKTAAIYKLASEGKYYFLSRPRRFGKSLLLSTMRAYFEGRRELFDGLAIAQMEKKWEQYPVLYLDLNTSEYNSVESLRTRLSHTMELWESAYGIESGNDRNLSLRFETVIRETSRVTGKKVVILIDEYDKPLLQTFDNELLQSEYRNQLKAFYGNLKSCDEFIRFAFLTGVTKFGKVSVFSDLNNLSDISLLPQYADICGITDEELHSTFDESVKGLAVANGISMDECYGRLAVYFDGYHFAPNSVGVYNPFSLLSTLRNQVFRDYWFETGTPTILINKLQSTNTSLDSLNKRGVSIGELGSIDVMNTNPLPLLFQSGYLTIKDYDPDFKTYTLDFPNREVELAFTQSLAPNYLPKNSNSGFSLREFVGDIKNGNAEGFVERLVAMFADGDYQISGRKEIYFQNTLYVIFKMLGFYVQVERHTSNGRMDVLIQTNDYIYIIEIKVDQNAETAIRQIEEKGYADSFATDPRRLFKIGINFNSETRKIDDWKVK